MATIIVVLALPVLLLMASLVFDGGRGVIAQRQTQNAADAAALAVATDCAQGTTGTSLTPYATNGTTLTGTGCGTSSTTATSTKQIQAAFPIAGGPWTVTRHATANWGALTNATGVFPITIATCAFQGLTFGQKVTLQAKNVGTCNNPSGQFGWTDINCTSATQVTTGSGSGINGTPGNTPKSCTNTQLNSFVGTDVLVPVWDQTITTCGLTYCLTTFAEFHLTGWSGNGNNFDASGTLQKMCNATADGGPNYSENTPCIRGYFVKFTQNAGQSSIGPCNTSTVLFACRVYLSS